MKLPWSKSASSDDAATSSASPVTEVVPRDPTAPKGRPTPKRRDVAPGRGPVAPPPQTSKEARARMKEKNRERRAQGLPAAKRERVPTAREERIARRDAGPERALVRNIVDSRRSLGSVFPLFAILVLVMTFSGMQQKNVTLYNYISMVWMAFFVLIILESLWLSRKIMKIVKERFPKSTERPGSLRFYGIMRSLMFRKGRYPKPVVSAGDDY